MGLLKFFNKTSNTTSSITENEVEKPTQRREYVRVEKCCAVTCHIINDSSESEEDISDIACETVNISGGGVKVLCPKGLLHLADILSGSILIDGHIIAFNMKVLHSYEAKCNLRTYGCKFTDIKDSERDLLIKLVFNELLKQRNTVGTIETSAQSLSKH